MNEQDSADDPNYSRSMERGLAILKCFTPERPVLGIAEIANKVGLRRPTTHRYVTTYVHLGFLARTPEHRYRLKLGVTGLGLSTMSSTSIEEHARTYIERLRWRTGYTVSLAVLDGPDILYLARMAAAPPGRRDPESDLVVGACVPAYCTAMGILLLSHVPEPVLSDLIVETKLDRLGPNTITSKKTLRAALSAARKRDLALNNEMRTSGVVAVAAPIRDDSAKVVAALSMTAHAPAMTLEKLTSAFSHHLLATADSISLRLGLRRNGDRGQQ
jgi:IclR family pca regulon transcriptional regulator